MFAFHTKTILTATFLSCMLSQCLTAGELSASLREASRLYQAGQYSAAISVAEKVNEYSPESVEAMLIIGMSHFNSKNYVDAKTWFRKALNKSPRHPIAVRYVSLIKEIEHRYGPFSSDLISARASEDPVKKGEAFKKSWFGHSFPKESEKTSDYFDQSKKIPAPIALEVEPPIEKILVEKSVARMANEAFAEKRFLKSYLFYSQLLSANPGNRSYLIGKAKSAFALKRYQEVIKILGPILMAAEEKSFSEPEFKLAKDLIQKARKQIYGFANEN
ncbi:MAG: hypothetical protein Kow0029_13970 [Candidatus Rifleibacteriota bacterium]